MLRAAALAAVPAVEGQGVERAGRARSSALGHPAGPGGARGCDSSCAGCSRASRGLTSGSLGIGRTLRGVYGSRVGRPAQVEREPIPPPLPPESRTVGQVVRRRSALPGQHRGCARARAPGRDRRPADRRSLAGGSRAWSRPRPPSASPTQPPRPSARARPPLATWLVAVVVGTITFLPAAFLFGWFAIAAILWLGLAGHAVPAIMAERSTLAALRRTVQLGRADYIHAAGSFATLALLFQADEARDAAPALGARRTRRCGCRSSSQTS